MLSIHSSELILQGSHNMLASKKCILFSPLMMNDFFTILLEQDIYLLALLRDLEAL